MKDDAGKEANTGQRQCDEREGVAGVERKKSTFKKNQNPLDHHMAQQREAPNPSLSSVPALRVHISRLLPSTQLKEIKNKKNTSLT